MEKFTTSTKSRRWSRKLLCYMFDVCRSNSQTIYAKNMGTNPRDFDSADFTWNLAKQLVMPMVQERKALQFRYLPADIKRTIEYFLTINRDQNQNQMAGVADNADGGAGDVNQNDPEAADNNLFPHPYKVSRNKRCGECLARISGVGYSQAVKKVYTVDIQCQKCCARLCKEHMMVICKPCAATLTVRAPPDNPDMD